MEMDPGQKPGYAVRQGPILAANLRAYLESNRLIRTSRNRSTSR